MTRIFLSHSRTNNREAIALKKWLVALEPPLANEIFLDLDSLHAGVKWKDALRDANDRCEAVICLLSKKWEKSQECNTEFRTAENLNKQIFPVRLETGTGKGITRDWQFIDLFGDGPEDQFEQIDLDDGGPPVVFPKKGLQSLKDEIIGKRVGPDSFIWPPRGDQYKDRCPYRGWNPLEEVDAGVFFGRDAQLLRALDELRGMRTTADTAMFVILGPSGAGKSSFLRAGLMPRLRRDDRNYLVLDIVRPQARAITGQYGLAKSISATRKRLGLTTNVKSLQDTCLKEPLEVARVAELLLEAQQAAITRLVGSGEGEPPTLVLPIDQAEELFSSEAGPEAARLLELIAHLAGKARPDPHADGQGQPSHGEPRKRLSLIVAATIRTDRHEALQTADQLAGVRSVVFGDLKPMPVDEFRQVIEGPARRSAESPKPVTLEASLVRRLLDECSEGADTLPLLALTLARMYEYYADDGLLELAEYLEMGGMRNVVQTEIDEILSANEATRHEQLEQLRSAFIPWLATIDRASDEPVRREADWDKLPAAAKPLLTEFVNKRLLVADKRKGREVVEVALESLFQHWDDLKKWLDEEREYLKGADALEHAAAQYRQHGSEDDLYQGERVTEAEELLDRPGFEERLAPARSFVEKSRERETRRTEEIARHKRLRRRSRIAVITALALIVCLVTGVAFWQRSVAERQFRETTGLQKAAEAEQILAGSRDGGDVKALQLLLAAQALGAPVERAANTRRDLLKIVENAPLDGSPASIRGVAVTALNDNDPASTRFATASDDSKVRVYDLAGHQVVPALDVGGTGPAWSVAFSPDGKTMATGNDSGELQLWDTATGARIRPANQHGWKVSTIAFSPNGRFVASGSDVDGSVRVWNVQDGIGFPQPLPHSPGPVSVGFVSDSVVVTGGGDGTVRITPLGGKPIEQQLDAAVTSLTISPAVHLVAGGTSDGKVVRLDARTLAPIGQPIEAHVGQVNSVAVTQRPEQPWIVSGGADNTVQVWDAVSGTPIGRPLIGHHAEVTSVAFDPFVKTIISGSRDGSVRVWDAVNGLPFPAGQGPLRAVAFDPQANGKVFATGGQDGTVKVWTAPEPKVLSSPPAGRVNGLAFSPVDRDTIVSASSDGVRRWSIRSGQSQQLAKSPGTLPFMTVAFSGDGRRVAAGSHDGSIHVWDTESWDEIAQIPTGHPVWAVALNGDGRQVVSGAGSIDNSVQLWDVDTRGQLGPTMVGANRNYVYAVAFGPEDQRIVSANSDGTIRLWGAKTQTSLGEPLRADRNPVLSVAYSHDGRWLASGDSAGKVRAWDMTKDPPQPIGAPFETGSLTMVTSVAFSPDSHRIVSASWDGTAHYWPADEDLKTMLCGKLTTNMSRQQWDVWVSPKIGYIDLCPGLENPDGASEPRKD